LTDQAATAWPCRIRHKRGCPEPSLSCNPEPFEQALSTIRAANIVPRDVLRQWTSAAGYSTHSSSAQAQGVPDTAEDLRWTDLPRSTQENRKLYSDGWTLTSTASGVGPIHEMLADINDIYRLCRRFNLLFDDAKAASSWPVIEVEFRSLPDDENVVFEVCSLQCTTSPR
jgi:hypothetical protein